MFIECSWLAAAHFLLEKHVRSLANDGKWREYFFLEGQWSKDERGAWSKAWSEGGYMHLG